jgi:DNA-binding transcriptional LysR family regulator
MLNETDLSRTDLNLLVLFEVVLQERHVGRAAARLNLSPSAVSHGLGRLRRLLNDPVFLRTPKGVVPTARAIELADPIRDALARMRSIIDIAEPFDPATSARRFTIGAPDGSAEFLSPLVTALRRDAPGIDISVRQLLPTQGGQTADEAWGSALADLETRAIDMAVLPFDTVPARFAERPLYQEDFVVGMRGGHPFTRKPTLDRYLQMAHLLVSQTGDPNGFIDRVLTEKGRTRRVALTVPNFMMALAIVSETDLLTALPRRFAAVHAARFGVVSVEAPLRLPRFQIRAITPKVALADAGLAWLFEALSRAVPIKSAHREKRLK